MPVGREAAVPGTRATLWSGTNMKGDAIIMKKHTRIVCFMAVCLVGFMGQLAAFGATTNSVWTLTSISTFKLSKINVAQTNPVTAVFLSDGTCSILVGSDEFDGTYTNTTRTLKITFSPAGVAALESNAFNFATSQVPSGITITIKSASKLPSIQLKSGVPVKATERISGKGSETVGRRTASKSFTDTDLLIDWTLSSGTNF
jgi:hypothetical protein